MACPVEPLDPHVRLGQLKGGYLTLIADVCGKISTGEKNLVLMDHNHESWRGGYASGD